MLFSSINSLISEYVNLYFNILSDLKNNNLKTRQNVLCYSQKRKENAEDERNLNHSFDILLLVKYLLIF